MKQACRYVELTRKGEELAPRERRELRDLNVQLDKERARYQPIIETRPIWEVDDEQFD
jgi:hypothetical protein